jgi:hypothetical protein
MAGQLSPNSRRPIGSLYNPRMATLQRGFEEPGDAETFALSSTPSRRWRGPLVQTARQSFTISDGSTIRAYLQSKLWTRDGRLRFIQTTRRAVFHFAGSPSVGRLDNFSLNFSFDFLRFRGFQDPLALFHRVHSEGICRW